MCPLKDEKKNDLIASAGKSIVGAVPFIGPLLSEIVDHLVPNQRLDRLALYVTELELRLAQAEEKIIKAALTQPGALALAEDGFIAASRSITPERTSYIASIVAKGLASEDIETNRQRYLLGLLSELNDEEILWLRYFLDPTIEGDKEFREKHAKVFYPDRAVIGGDESLLDRNAIKSSYIEHLERLGLVKGNIRIDRQTKMPEFDTFTGRPRVSFTHITHLGRMLLREIDMLNKTNT